MKALPNGYKIVGAIAIAFGVLSFIAWVGLDTSGSWRPKNTAEYLFVSSRLALLCGGFLLVKKEVWQVRTASGVLAIAGVLLIWEATAISFGMIESLEKDRTGFLGVLLAFPVMVLPPAILGPIVLLTGVLLCLRLRRTE